MPVADVAPVVHGRWVHLGGDEWCCSECGFVITTEGSWDKPTKNTARIVVQRWMEVTMLSRYYDADKLKEMINRQYQYCHGYTGTKKDIYREALLAVKSAIHCQSVSGDMQEVVRCNDCEHYNFGVCLKIYSDGHPAPLQKRRPDDFCSYGVRMKED